MQIINSLTQYYQVLHTSISVVEVYTPQKKHKQTTSVDFFSFFLINNFLVQEKKINHKRELEELLSTFFIK